MLKYIFIVSLSDRVNGIPFRGLFLKAQLNIFSTLFSILS